MTARFVRAGLGRPETPNHSDPPETPNHSDPPETPNHRDNDPSKPIGTMFDSADLGDGWTVWNDDDDRAVLAYRPDVFDGTTFPAPCLPTVYVTRGRPNRRPEGNRTLPPNAPWVVTLRLEPDVEHESDTHGSRADAIEGAERLTGRFSAGDLDYRSLYQVPREPYLDELDELTGSRR